jgi:site-specific DNA recombinase
MTRYVALYCRLSPRPDGKYEGVDLQERWGRDYAQSAWPDLPIEVFADTGISAANGDARPDYERLREWVAAGQVAHVWTVEQSRLERREAQWFELAALLDAAGITELHTNRDGLIRVRDEVAGIRAVLAAGESRKIRQRTRDTLAEKAANGEAPAARPFGYVHARNSDGSGTYAIVPEQAEAIRFAAEKVLDGWGLSNIAAALRSRGLRGGHGGKLTAGAVRRMVTVPSVAGLRVHRGRVVGKGNWEPILDEQIWQQVRIKLDANRVVRRSDGKLYPVSGNHRGKSAGRKYLLTGGLAACGICEHPLVGSIKHQTGGHTKPYLLCHPNKGGRGCVGIVLEATEGYVVDRLFAELDRPEFLAAIASDDHADRRDGIVAALGTLEARRNELAELWAGPGELTAAEWRTARRALSEREQQLRADLAGIPAPLDGIDIAGARDAWDDMTLDEQRAFVRLFITSVTISRAKPGAKRFDPGRVDIGWRTL